MVWIISLFTLTGYNFTFWTLISFVRYISETFVKKKEKVIFHKDATIHDVAAIIPAHNEERTIRRTIRALLKLLPKEQIYVASDFSTDKTNTIVRSFGVRLLDIKPNIGKAKALVKVMRDYQLLKNYKYILINDADTEIDSNYLHLALPYFTDKHIAAVATHGVTRMQRYTFWQRFFIAYRIRLWRIIQIFMRFGQTWKYTNVSFIIPGSLSLYRSSVLRKLKIDAPGLLIEDFNMTFEVHKKKLGKIAYSPRIFGIHQDPYNFRDYIKQVRRWNVGFFQTVKRHGIWPSLFWITTTSYYVELYLFALFVLCIPLLFILYIASSFQPISFPLVAHNLAFRDLFIGVFLIDYGITTVAAFLERQPVLLLYGLGFFVLRYIDAIIYVTSPFIAFFSKSKGVWHSPKRL